jgi:DNA polymerase-4
MVSQRVILHVDLDAFFVAVEQARDPSLRGKPVVVGGDPGGRGVVATASYEARAFGVHSALPLRTAQRLCPDAIFVRGNYREYARVSRAFHRILSDFSPLVEPGGLDEAYLDITGCGPVIESLSQTRCSTPEELGRAAGEAIRRRMKDDLTLNASVGVASCRSTAKIASDAAKPDGLLVVPFGGEAAFLAPRPVRDLPGLGAKAEGELTRLGVRTLGQLAALPDGVLRRLFGSWGPDLAQRARGIDASAVGAGRAGAKSVSREGTFAENISDIDVLRATLRGFAESVGAELRRMEKRAKTVQLKLRYGDFSTISRSHTIDRPTHSDDVLYETGVSLLERALDQDGRAVRLLGLGATGLVEDAVQAQLFEDQEVRGEELLRAVDGVRGRYGNRAVQRGRTFFDPVTSSDDWEPEKQTGLSSQLGLKKEGGN